MGPKSLIDVKRDIFKREINQERGFLTDKPKGYKYYNPKNFTTNPRKIYEAIDKLEATYEREERKKEYGEKELRKVPLVSATFTFGHATQKWRTWDNRIVKEEVRERTLNGKNIDMAIKILNQYLLRLKIKKQL